jgi:hypothetical protein
MQAEAGTEDSGMVESPASAGGCLKVKSLGVGKNDEDVLFDGVASVRRQQKENTDTGDSQLHSSLLTTNVTGASVPGVNRR